MDFFGAALGISTCITTLNEVVITKHFTAPLPEKVKVPEDRLHVTAQTSI